MSENLNVSGKPAWLRIAGDQAFNVYSLIFVSSIATIGTLSFYASYDATKFLINIAILGASQLGALSPIFVIAPIAKKIESNANRFAVIIATFIFANVLRSIFVDILFVKWGVESEHHLAFRLYSNVIFVTLMYIILAWVADFIFENFVAFRKQESLAEELQRELFGVVSEISEARTFGSRELMIEIATLNSALESLPPELGSEPQTQQFIDQINEAMERVGLRARQLERSFPNRNFTPEISPSVKLSASKVISAGTYFRPYSPKLMGGLSFIALVGWLNYFIDRATALSWAAYLGAYSAIVYWLFARFLVPIMRRFKPAIRLVIYELSLVPFTFFWLALLGYYVGDNSTTYVIAATNSISVFVFANLATFVSGALDTVRENRRELDDSIARLQAEVDSIRKIKQREERVWRALFTSDIAKSPTMATVQIREAISDLDQDGFEKIQPAVLAVWRTMDESLAL